MTFDPPLIDGLSIPAIALRHADALMLTSDGTAGGSRPGVRPGDTSLKVSLSGAGNTTINTAAGVASCSYPAQGVYRAYNQTAWTGTTSAAHATLDRVDLVYLRVWDNTVDSSGLAKADVVYLAGTPATTPVAPTPSGTLIYLPLATISVPSVSHGGSPGVTDARPVAVAPGGITVDAGATAGTYVGQYRDTGLGMQRWNGTNWSDLLVAASLAVGNTDATATPLGVNAPSGQTGRPVVVKVGTTEIMTLTAAGKLTTAGGLVATAGVGSRRTFMKPADTPHTSSTTYATDVYFTSATVTVEANATYVIDGFLQYAGAANGSGDMKYLFQIPSGAVMFMATGASLATGLSAYDGTAISGPSGRIIGTNGAIDMASHFAGYITTASTAGGLNMQWAQSTSSATSTILRAGSWLRLERIA